MAIRNGDDADMLKTVFVYFVRALMQWQCVALFLAPQAIYAYLSQIQHFVLSNNI